MDAVELQCPNPISSDSSYSINSSEQETRDNEGVLTMSHQLGCGPASNSRLVAVLGPRYWSGWWLKCLIREHNGKSISQYLVFYNQLYQNLYSSSPHP